MPMGERGAGDEVCVKVAYQIIDTEGWCRVVQKDEYDQAHPTVKRMVCAYCLGRGTKYGCKCGLVESGKVTSLPGPR